MEQRLEEISSLTRHNIGLLADEGVCLIQEFEGMRSVKNLSSNIPIGGTLTHSLLESIFYPGNPLHDGAVLVRSDTVVSAANVLPLSNIHVTDRKLGTRHRAAIGLTERCDALVLVVSEETGQASFAISGVLHPFNMSPFDS